MPQPANIAMQKKHLRDAAIARRMALPEPQRATAEAIIANRLDALIGGLEVHTLGFCWPHRGEPDLRDWVARWLAVDQRRSAALPVVVAPRQPMLFRHWTPASEMVPDRHGIPQPVSGAPLRPELVLVPVNAFDDRGYRIGYGGGYFDRTLAALDPRPLCIGIGFACARVPDALPEAHDLPMQWVVTEDGLLDLMADGSGQHHR